MKKLLSLLSVLTISGTAVPTIIAASPYQKQEKLIRTKRDNENMLAVKYKAFGHDWLFAKISNDTWRGISFNHDNKINSEFYDYVFSLINEFEKRNHSGDALSQENFWQDDVIIIAKTIVDHFENINNVYKNKKDNTLGIILRTDRDSRWSNNDDWWGAHINTFDYEVWE